MGAYSNHYANHSHYQRLRASKKRLEDLEERIPTVPRKLKKKLKKELTMAEYAYTSDFLAFNKVLYSF